MNSSQTGNRALRAHPIQILTILPSDIVSGQINIASISLRFIFYGLIGEHKGRSQAFSAKKRRQARLEATLLFLNEGGVSDHPRCSKQLWSQEECFGWLGLRPCVVAPTLSKGATPSMSPVGALRLFSAEEEKEIVGEIISGAKHDVSMT